MKLLINMSNNIAGGSLQVGLSFIRECRAFSQNYYIIVINSCIEYLLTTEEYPVNFKFIVVKKSHFFQLSRIMSKIERKEKPDIVFTVFGPSYWRPSVKHVIGFANPYYYQMGGFFKKNFSSKQYLLLLLKKLIHTYYMNKDTDILITETDYTTERYLKIFKKIKVGYTVSNTCSDYFTIYKEKKQVNKKAEDRNFKLLILSKYYPHKNFEILKEVTQILSERNVVDIRFIVTLDDISFNRLFVNNEYVINKGFVKPLDCPKLYDECDAMFLPTLAECFSASYPEAMVMEKPILTSDLPFAKTICKNAAIYFNPLNSKDIVEKILLLKNDVKERNRLVKEGIKEFSKIPNAKKRANNYITICEELNSDI